MSSETVKRQNFNVTSREEAELNHLRETLGAASVKDAIMRATRVVLTLAQEVQEGRKIYAADRQGRETRLLLPDVEAVSSTWNYLTARPHAWKRQLYIKGRRQTAANVWLDMLANGLSVAGAAENWDLPVEAIEEIVSYCEANRQLIGMEADEVKHLLQEKGVRLDPEPAA
jgi:hypothetical protein